MESAVGAQKEMRVQGIELVGLGAAALLILALFLPWFTLSHEPVLRQHQDAWVCGPGKYTCSGWDTFPLNRYLFLAAAAAPMILAYFVLTSQRGKYPTGEFTMTVGLAVIVLVGFNGIIQKPGTGVQFGVGLSYGYFLAILAGMIMAVTGALRSLESGGGAGRKPPATF
jgi:hypothetical protein